MKILLSRTDSIGDVILTLPMAGVLKHNYPNCEIFFLGRKYTKDVVLCCSSVNHFLDWDEIQKDDDPLRFFKQEKFDAIVHVFPNKSIAQLAKQAKIPLRIGTNRRYFNLIYCNKLVNLSRKNSHLHESQLNLKLLTKLNISYSFSLKELGEFLNFNRLPALGENFISLIDPKKFNLILHPKSKGSAREWSAENYIELCNNLPPEKFKVFVSGTKEEESEINEKILSHCQNAISVVGKFKLSEFISFIDACDGLVACSTGPLHIAGALGKRAIGLYPPIKNMTPSRWAALGPRAINLTGPSKNGCSVKICNKNKKCDCLNLIKPKDIFEYMN